MGRHSTIKTITLLLVLLSVSALSFAFDEPLQINNLFPLTAYLNRPDTESARLKTGISISLSYGSINMFEQSQNYKIALDMEMSELSVNFRKALFSNSVELGINIPFISCQSGFFMDDFLNKFHNAFGFPDYGRSYRPNNEFAYEILKNGKTAIKGRNGDVAIGDIALSVKKTVYSKEPIISVKGQIELPAGDGKSGFSGNEEIDFSICALMDNKITERINMFSGAGVIFPGDIKAYETVSTQPYGYISTGASIKLMTKLHFLTSVLAETSPLKDTGIGKVNNTAIAAAFGFRYEYKKKTYLHLSITEDLNTTAAPDFTANISFMYNPL
ncbi:hypothetical protein MCHI_003249 [Candidatus Magnetoovum chiemensis]|nr:hypothetical protein MCHI_003249 [Candidatus Magnetoovum chiemensis]